MLGVTIEPPLYHPTHTHTNTHSLEQPSHRHNTHRNPENTAIPQPFPEGTETTLRFPPNTPKNIKKKNNYEPSGRRYLWPCTVACERTPASSSRSGGRCRRPSFRRRERSSDRPTANSAGTSGTTPEDRSPASAPSRVGEGATPPGHHVRRICGLRFGQGKKKYKETSVFAYGFSSVEDVPAHPPIFSAEFCSISRSLN